MHVLPAYVHLKWMWKLNQKNGNTFVFEEGNWMAWDQESEGDFIFTVPIHIF